MSYGFIARNNDSYIQIDSETPRLCAIHRGTYAATFDRVARVSFPSPITTVEPPCIFIRNDPARNNELYDAMSIVGSAGNWTGFNIQANNVTWRPAGKWFAAVFASVAQSRYGLRIFGVTGEIVFDSGSTPVVVTKANQDWSYAGYVQFPSLGGAHLYNNALVAPMAEDEYFMINPFSRGLLQPSVTNWTTAGVRFDWGANRLQIYALTNRPQGGVWLDIGQPAGVFARLPGT